MRDHLHQGERRSACSRSAYHHALRPDARHSRTCYLMLPGATIGSNAAVVQGTRSASSPAALGEFRDPARRTANVLAGQEHRGGHRPWLCRRRGKSNTEPTISGTRLPRTVHRSNSVGWALSWSAFEVVNDHGLLRYCSQINACITFGAMAGTPWGSHRMHKEQPVLRRPQFTPGNN